MIKELRYDLQILAALTACAKAELPPGSIRERGIALAMEWTKRASEKNFDAIALKAAKSMKFNLDNMFPAYILWEINGDFEDTIIPVTGSEARIRGLTPNDLITIGYYDTEEEADAVIMTYDTEATCCF